MSIWLVIPLSIILFCFGYTHGLRGGDNFGNR